MDTFTLEVQAQHIVLQNLLLPVYPYNLYTFLPPLRKLT